MIVGHSLGAATAAILSLTLKHKYPTLRCLGYGMPASVYDWRTAQGIESVEVMSYLIFLLNRLIKFIGQTTELHKLINLFSIF